MYVGVDANGLYVLGNGSASGVESAPGPGGGDLPVSAAGVVDAAGGAGVCGLGCDAACAVVVQLDAPRSEAESAARKSRVESRGIRSWLRLGTNVPATGGVSQTGRIRNLKRGGRRHRTIRRRRSHSAGARRPRRSRSTR